MTARRPRQELGPAVALRRAIRDGDEASFPHVWTRTLTASDDPGRLVLDAVGPVEDATLSSLPLRIAERLFPALLDLTSPDPRSYVAVAHALFAHEHGGRTSDLLEQLRIERLIMHGRLEEAEARLGRCDDPRASCFHAFLALREGDEERAMRLYDDGLTMMRDEGLPQSWPSWMGMFHAVLSYKEGDARGVEARLGDMEGSSLAEDMSVMISSLRRALGVAKGVPVPRPSAREHGLAVFPLLLLSHWMGGDAEDTREAALGAIEWLDARELWLLSAELRAAWGMGGGRVSVPHPLSSLIDLGAGWERSLSELSNIGSPKRTDARRLVWEAEWETDGTGRVASLSLTPMEQSWQRRGWSRGRNVSLRRLGKSAGEIRGATEQDARVASAVRAVHSYWGTDWSMDAPKALEILAGHPLVFKAGSGERLEVVATEPVLSVREEPRGYVLTLSPWSEGEARVIEEDGSDRLKVTRFEERHLRVAHVLGPSGLMIPTHAKERLLQALTGLSSVVVIQSDLDGIGGAAEAVPPDARIYVQLQPEGEGLSVGIVTRPLGPEGPSCRPGRGAAALFCLREGRRVRTDRILAAESEAVDAFVAACPVLLEGMRPWEDAWSLPSPALALELLAQIEALGDHVSVEWPKGQSMALLPRPVGEEALSISIRRDGDWFSLSGEVRVDEGLVLGMRTIVDAMRSGRGRFVPLGEGKFLALTRELQRRLEGLCSLGDVRGDETRLSPLAISVAEELIDDVGQVDAPEEWRTRASLIASAARMISELPATFCGELREYQLEGFRWMMRLAHWGGGACLADDMGLGKTVQALAVLLARGHLGPSLVVAPTSVCPNWEIEAARFAPTLKVKDIRRADREAVLTRLGPMDIVVTSYGILQSERGLLRSIDWNVIVLDEAQAIKNRDAKRSSAAMGLRGAFRIATTGTPIENGLRELWALFRFLVPGYLGTFESFWRRFGTPIERNGDRDARARLRAAIRPFILRRTKEQVLRELPEKTEIVLRVDLKDEERAFYEAVRRDAIEELSGPARGVGRFEVLAALMRLRRACCSASLVDPSVALPSAKLDAFADVMGELRGGGHRALVFSQFVDHLSILRGWLDERGISYRYLDGSTPQDERAHAVASFQAGEGDCFLISLRAGGTGLNLTGADYVVHMDPWWNPAVEDQASDRAHRIGQTRPVTVYRVVARDTIEEKIVALHEWKRELADGLLDEGGATATLSVEELLALICGQ